MNPATFYIVLNIKTVTGFESIGKFFIGNSREAARIIFSQLKGRKNVHDGNIIHFDLMEMVNGLPLNMHMFTCTLEELAENCKIITREAFKLFTLEPPRR